MRRKPLWIALVVCICLITIVVMSAEKSRQADAGGVIDPTCTSSSPCIEYDNNGTGPGIRGISVSGNGLAGATKNHSTSASNGRSGLIGNDIGTGTFNSGVHGLSVNGTGVFGIGPHGVTGENTPLTSSDAIFAQGLGGRLFRGNNHLGQDVFVVDDGGNATIAGGTSIHGSIGVSQNGTIEGGLAVGGGLGGVSGGTLTVSTNMLVPSLAVTGDINTTGNINSTGGLQSQFFFAFANGNVGLDLYEGRSPNGALVFYVTEAGDVHAHSFTSDLAATRIQPTGTGRSVRTYSQQSSEPNVEDFGEAQLSNGEAYVLLSRDFANVVDQHANYLVFIAPEGDNRGLYVTQKSPAGFVVRESQGGRSTLAFSYRIVAKPFGSHEARLPTVELPKLHSGLPTQPRRFHSEP